MAKRWTPAEQAILTEIWTTPCLLKVEIDRLPGRTYNTAVQHAINELKLGPKCPPVSKVFRQATELMADKKVRSVSQIAEAIGRSYPATLRVMRAAVERGEFRVVRWCSSQTGGELQAFYQIGRGKSVPKPAPMNAAERARKFRERAKGIEYEIKRKRYAATQQIRINPPRDELLDAFYGRCAPVGVAV